ncbi:hypothetical protein E2C01_091923 [Portunus trituberculatus]|uniref:Uncharacterized protein n=1 Tax=Portunus trituberculatus TaxID=210409 RepID=A0A5B7JKB4_PORTR|nr:hypothetical protein [Portunus trituberculatus]
MRTVTGGRATPDTRPLGKVGRHFLGAALHPCLALPQVHHSFPSPLVTTPGKPVSQEAYT